MQKIPYEIEIDIFQVPNRNCRYYQEKIYEYGDLGRVRYEWERIRQEYVLKKNDFIEQICADCPINILLDVEGCKGRLYEFETFMRMLPNVKPDSILLQKNVLNCKFNEDETRQLIEEMEKLHEECKLLTWPVAQIFINDEPVTSEISINPDKYVYYEWSGEENQIYFTTNQGYHVGITNEGILLKKNFGDTLPDVFSSIKRKGMRVTGTTINGKTTPIPIHRAVLPEWWPDDPQADSELRFTNLPIADVFLDVFNMLIVFSETALKHFTGVNIFSEFYRRA